ncbi:MAG: hypothetical protein AAGH92_01550 [Planctomycetota bacterium]
MSAPRPKDPLNAELLTWSALLVQCVRLAQAAVALPDDASEKGEQARAWRESVPHVIRLQAIWFALERSQELTADELALGRDRAAVALDESGVALRQFWSNAHLEMPGGITSLLQDVRVAIDMSDGEASD